MSMRIEGSSVRRSTRTSGATRRPGPVAAHPARTTPASSQGRARAAGIRAARRSRREPLLSKPPASCQDAAVSPTAQVALLWLGFAALHLLPNGSTTDVAFFGGFVAFALVGAWHQDRRKLALGVPGFRAFHEATPFLPFTGRDTLRGLRELSPAVMVAGIAAAAVVRYYHAAWFGG